MGANQDLVDYFEIPNELAQRLSDLLTKQVIRERVLEKMLQESDISTYEEAERLLEPVVAEIEAIKLKITREFVPEKYRSTRYVWNYNGYSFDGNKVEVLEVK